MWARHVEREGEKRNVCRIFVEKKTKKRGRLEDLSEGEGNT